MYACVYIYINIYIYMHVCMCVYLYIYGQQGKITIQKLKQTCAAWRRCWLHFVPRWHVDPHVGPLPGWADGSNKREDDMPQLSGSHPPTLGQMAQEYDIQDSRHRECCNSKQAHYPFL